MNRISILWKARVKSDFLVLFEIANLREVPAFRIHTGIPMQP